MSTATSNGNGRQAVPSQALRDRFVREAEAEVDKHRKRKVELLEQAEEAERAENEARAMLRLLKTRAMP